MIRSLAGCCSCETRHGSYTIASVFSDSMQPQCLSTGQKKSGAVGPAHVTTSYPAARSHPA